VHAWIEPDATGGIARADQVGVRIPDARRIETLPGDLDEFVLEKAPRQDGQAGIPEALLGPEFPRSQCSGAGNGRAADNEISPLQAGQFFM